MLIKEYREKLLLEIKTYINKYAEEFKRNERIEYTAANKDCLLTNIQSAKSERIGKSIVTVFIILR